MLKNYKKQYIVRDLKSKIILLVKNFGFIANISKQKVIINLKKSFLDSFLFYIK